MSRTQFPRKGPLISDMSCPQRGSKPARTSHKRNGAESSQCSAPGQPARLLASVSAKEAAITYTTTCGAKAIASSYEVAAQNATADLFLRIAIYLFVCLLRTPAPDGVANGIHIADDLSREGCRYLASGCCPRRNYGPLLSDRSIFFCVFTQSLLPLVD